jgi:flagellar basal-body rod protein FlgB
MIAITDNGTTALLGLALDAAVMRHQAIAHNIANANTAGYRPLGVSFESRLGAVKDALARGTGVTPASVAAARPAVETAPAAEAVRIDAEIARLSENTLHHQALLKMLNRHFSIVSAAIGEGKR